MDVTLPSQFTLRCFSMHLVWDSAVFQQLLLLFFVEFLKLICFIPGNMIGNLNFFSNFSSFGNEIRN
jgi:hypothetical protein